MRQTVERLLFESTSASRCLLAIAAVNPFVLAYLATHSYALFSPDVRPGLHTGVMWFMQALLLLAEGTLLITAAWLWPKRRGTKAHPRIECLVIAVIGVIYTAVPILAGSFSAGPTLALLGVAVVGLLLFPWQTMLAVMSLCAAALISYNLLTLLFDAPYAPAITPQAFQQGEPRWWWSFWQGMVLYVGLPAVVFVVMMLFASHDAMHRQLQHLSSTDALTGLANRRLFMDRLQAELARQERHHRPLSVLLIDADHFKRINDLHGHAMGDEVLKALAQVLATSVRSPVDVVARLGGEEFGLLLPDTTLDEAQAVVERLQDRLQGLVFTDAAKDFGLTVSLGGVQCLYSQPKQVLTQVDANLYRAKADGRNRAVYSVLESPIGDEALA
jgi:diguanylate cyclase (GGDEF)-like protein